MSLLCALYGIIALFFLILIARLFIAKEKREKVCSICIATTLTWISLLVLYYFKKFDDIVIISLLMGITLLGIFYTVERKVKKELTFFRLPFFATLIVLGYFILTLGNIAREIILLIALWLAFGLIYYYRESPKFKEFVNKVVECCKKW